MAVLGKQKNEMAAVHLMNSFCRLFYMRVKPGR